MKRIILVFIMILTAGVLFSLGSREPEEREYQFAILIKKGDESWYRKEAEGFVSRCDELGVSSIIL